MPDSPEEGSICWPAMDAAREGGRAETPDVCRAAESAYESHGRLLLRLALAECRDEGLAEDAVQEAFLRYQEALQAGVHIRSVRAWLARVVVNFLRDAARRSARQERLAAAGSLAGAPQAEGGAGELEARIRALLSPREFQCVRLRVLGYQYMEIAESLGLRPGSVACLLSRAMRKLEALR
ncbi:MAG: RNA polymerase sigma factor [Bryobacteraceae bacterium]